MKEYEIHLVEEVRAGRLTRRELIRRASVFGLSLGAIGSLVTAKPVQGIASGPASYLDLAPVWLDA